MGANFLGICVEGLDRGDSDTKKWTEYWPWEKNNDKVGRKFS